jgi:hypothetical protein
MPISGLTGSRRIAWYAGSITFSLFMVWFIDEKALLQNPETAKFEMAVLGLAWIAIIILLRLACRDMKEEPDSERG